MTRLNRVLLTAILLSAASTAWAQNADENAETAQQEVAQEDAAPAAEGSEAEAEGAPEEGAEAAPAEGTEAPAEAEGQPASNEPVLGPGGRPLRTDYPGTDESLQARMDSNQVQGLQVDPNMPQEAYSMKIQELETKIDDLKEKVFQSKTRIVLLRETLLSGNLAGARAIVIHKTDMGRAFKLREALYSLDGSKVFGQVDRNGSLADKNSFEVYNGGIAPGNHNLSIFLKYQGSGYGLFPYFNGYDFEIRSSCQFKAEEGKISQIRVVAYEKGNAATSKEDRPFTRCEVQFFDNIRTDEGAVGDEAK
ncbi:hypothetical protein [Microvenator marinus]|uniref:hypothetical protein n=1 Tax=Microvenator marinus TaxID=2600177 RepID=UPI00201B71DF|nr:hypothetical protein [Microvenator marinus]